MQRQTKQAAPRRKNPQIFFSGCGGTFPKSERSMRREFALPRPESAAEQEFLRELNGE